MGESRMIKSVQLDLEKESILIPISEPDTAITNSEPPIPTTEEVKLEVIHAPFKQPFEHLYTLSTGSPSSLQ